MNSYIACHDCDLLHRRQPLPPAGVATCSRCGTVLYRSRRNSLDRTLAMAVCGLILFIIANLSPFLTLKFEGQTQETNLVTGVMELYRQGMVPIALLVMATGIAFPLLELTGLIYMLLPLKFDRTPWGMAGVFRVIRALQPWGMTEVFLLGILVSIVKLAGMATVIPGAALYAFLALIFVVAATAASLDPDIVWDRVKITP
ncbi:paraquat-inducible protein A [Desulfatitalea tepidiphila]|uniref:paraquat-inducible protein A n=1 Tax=Desulfatitalea tepidiphila TaxID=1185843 RepID=UPI0006B3FFA3|nr:paraquat-inducible protein A [Desulfatitalea tepidiphila]